MLIFLAEILQGCFLVVTSLVKKGRAVNDKNFKIRGQRKQSNIRWGPNWTEVTTWRKTSLAETNLAETNLAETNLAETNLAGITTWRKTDLAETNLTED